MALGVPDTGYYEAQKRQVNQQYGVDSANNAYSRFLSQQRGERDLGAMQRGYQRSFPNFRAQQGQRGMTGGGLRSGVMNQAMSRYMGDYTRSYGEAQNDLTESLRQFDLNQAQLTSGRDNALADYDLEKAREIAFAAQNIEQLRSMLGGL